MDTAMLVAKLLGPVYLAVGLGFLLQGDHYEKMIKDFVKSPGLLYMGGIMAMLVGLLIVGSHNLWVKDWTVLVTIIGWLALLKGVWLLVLPETATEQTKSMIDSDLWMGLAKVIALVVGAWFTYVGYLM